MQAYVYKAITSNSRRSFSRVVQKVNSKRIC